MSKTRTQPRLRAVPAVSRAIAILNLLSRSPTPLHLKDIAQQLGQVPSTALHILRVLEANQLVFREAKAGAFRLGVGLVALGRSALKWSSFPSLVQPKLDQLSSTYGVTAIGVEIADIDQMVVVALARSRAPVSLHVDIGTRFPSLMFASGRLVAAFSELPEKEIERRFRSLNWHNAPSYESWRKEVESARLNGFSIDHGQFIAGVTVVTVPVFDPEGRITHSISAVGLESQLSRKTARLLAREMKFGAEEISTQLASFE